mmetsp:Transcript_26788/g.58254  ORF Transcript_26788/g.58254 Transcript_26788/m.58254 type:complete len:531 (+) Transcript_26788:81-1673(+)|eukprot:CAMPEP_0206462216 /NCGR_PEP_ID=MMETSP0324_2-20121206/25852_1 /ASSEMBLY_ACC=CAM_ASM_000836 /TAXON_ID=2866 /ORGANISM="Crypthecodinium cohnii, Strain Seligo" /LENGTH=530 /DNA_ID=CAMNT_0053934341 /DNA_START=43 /DNA_END=1635 /DNA_ORIENTATION=+
MATEEPETAVASTENALIETPTWESNSLGVWDGQAFYLRSFAIWYRWRMEAAARAAKKPESGELHGVHFQQTMGKMTLWYDLATLGEVYTEDEVAVEMSCWQLEVQVGKDLGIAKNRVSGGRKVEALTGELFADVRLHLSWWELQSEGASCWLVIHLTKLDNRAWPGPWFTDCFNPHKKTCFPWSDRQTMSTVKEENEKISRKWPGPPQDLEKELSAGMLPENLCTGLDEEEDELYAIVIVHLDEANMERANGRVPMEELFSADVQSERLELYLRNDSLGICVGTFKGRVDPQFSAWEITSVRRKNLPKGSNIKCPAFFNPALRIKLAKAQSHRGFWGGVFAERQTVDFQLPQERISWTDRLQRALVLSPSAPLKPAVKAEKAKAMCTRIECTQDTVTQRANIILHLEGGLEELAFKFKLDLTNFFALKVGERLLDVAVVADAEFTMVVGRLGGAVEPDKTTWEIVREKDALGSDKEHLAIKISLAKAMGSRDRWTQVFEPLEPWQVSDLMRPALEGAVITDGAGTGEVE